jgi:hypothetical protein
MTETNGTEEVVEEVGEWTPAEVRMLRWMIVPLETPMGWNLRNVIFLRLVVAYQVSPRRCDGVG